MNKIKVKVCEATGVPLGYPCHTIGGIEGYPNGRQVVSKRRPNSGLRMESDNCIKIVIKIAKLIRCTTIS